MPAKKITNQDILEAVNEFSRHVEGRFQRLENNVAEIKKDIVGIKGEIVGMTHRMNGMVTKDLFLATMGDFRDDMKSEENMVVTLVDVLTEKQVLTPAEQKRIVKMGPFRKR